MGVPSNGKFDPGENESPNAIPVVLLNGFWAPSVDGRLESESGKVICEGL